MRPSKVIANAFNAPFRRDVPRARPLPVGSRARVARYRYVSAACSWGKFPRVRIARGYRALSELIAFDISRDLHLHRRHGSESDHDRRQSAQSVVDRSGDRCRLAAASDDPRAGRRRWIPIAATIRTEMGELELGDRRATGLGAPLTHHPATTEWTSSTPRETGHPGTDLVDRPRPQRR